MKATPLVRVRDVAAFLKGRKPSVTLEAPFDGALPYVLIDGFGGTYKSFTNDPACVRCHRDDTIIVADGANTGLTSTSHDGYLGSTLGALRPDGSKVNHRYLFYFVHGNFHTLNTRTRGAAVPHLDRELLLDLEFALPALPEQERIVRILDEADVLRRLRAQADDRTRGLADAAFIEVFGEPRANPKKWPICVLGEVTQRITSGSRGWSRFAGKGSGRFLRTQDVSDGEIADDLLPVEPPQGAEADRTRLALGDVVVTITGIVGKAAVFRGSAHPVFISQHVSLVRPDPRKLVAEYLVAYANLSYGDVPVFARLQYGQTKPGLGFRELRSTPIPLPPKGLQDRFAARVAEIRQLQAAQAASRQRLEDLFQSLVHRAFQGEL
jgi:type I restriction enzyme, S subunit